jgi:hypothetical protein
MLLGLVIYNWPSNIWLSFISYGIGLVLTTGLLLYKDNPLMLWIIPMIWEVVVFGVDRLLGRLDNN